MLSVPGKITNRIQALGIPFLPIYLIKGKEYAIIDGGIKALYPYIKKQLTDLKIDSSKITYNILLHTHIDHVGLAPAFKTIFKNIKTCCSEDAKPLLEKLEKNKNLQEMEKRLALILKLSQKGINPDFQTKRMTIDKFLTENDRIDLGNGVSIKIIKTPGHSPCSLSAYIKKDKAMFVSDSAGLMISPKMIFPTVFGNFDEFIESQKKLDRYNVHLMLFGHLGVLKGKEARGFFKNTYQETEKLRGMILEKLREKKSRQRIVSELSKIYYKGFTRKLTKAFFDGSVNAMINLLDCSQ